MLSLLGIMKFQVCFIRGCLNSGVIFCCLGFVRDRAANSARNKILTVDVGVDGGPLYDRSRTKREKLEMLKNVTPVAPFAYMTTWPAQTHGRQFSTTSLIHFFEDVLGRPYRVSGLK